MKFTPINLLKTKHLRFNSQKYPLLTKRKKENMKETVV